MDYRCGVILYKGLELFQEVDEGRFERGVDYHGVPHHIGGIPQRIPHEAEQPVGIIVAQHKQIFLFQDLGEHSGHLVAAGKPRFAEIHHVEVRHHKAVWLRAAFAEHIIDGGLKHFCLTGDVANADGKVALAVVAVLEYPHLLPAPCLAHGFFCHRREGGSYNERE